MRRYTGPLAAYRRGQRRVGSVLGGAALVLIAGVIVWLVVGVRGYARVWPAFEWPLATAQGWLVACSSGPLLIVLAVGVWAVLTGGARACADALHLAIVLAGLTVLADILFNLWVFVDFSLTSESVLRDLIGTLQLVALVSLLTHVAAGALSLLAQRSLVAMGDTGATRSGGRWSRWWRGRWSRWWLEDRR